MAVWPAFAVLLVGCTVGPDFHPPIADAPFGNWGPERKDIKSVTTYGGPADATWWSTFKDAELTSLVVRLARQNLQLQAAAERVQQGREQRRIAAAQGLPTLDSNGLYNRVRSSPSVVTKLFVAPPGAPLEFDFWQGNLSSSWEVDLFGRVRREVEARRADTEAVIEERRGIGLMAISDLAQDYMQLRGTQAMTAITEASLADADRNVWLVHTQFDNGVSTTLDIANAAAQRATIAAQLPPLRAMQARLINAIGYLLAEPPRALQGELQKPGRPPPVPPAVPVGLPGDLARRRPDVREAEAQLHAATAETGVAIANFYPDVKLTGQIGTEALQFPQEFNLMSGYYMVGPSIDIPIFEGGRLRATLRLRRSQQRQAAINYRNTVLQAWQDADNALTAYAEAQSRREHTAEAVRQNQVALGASRDRYKQGVVDFLNVISAENALYQSQDSLAQDDTQIETDLVALYRALGGGWEIAG